MNGLNMTQDTPLNALISASEKQRIIATLRESLLFANCIAEESVVSQIIARVEATPASKCKECFNYDAPNQYCIHWYAVVPNEWLISGCDAFENDDIPF